MSSSGQVAPGIQERVDRITAEELEEMTVHDRTKHLDGPIPGDRTRPISQAEVQELWNNCFRTACKASDSAKWLQVDFSSFGGTPSNGSLAERKLNHSHMATVVQPSQWSERGVEQ
jgi:hypothetical protein